MSERVPVATFIRDEQLLGPWFSGPSWRTWMTVLRGAFGEKLGKAEHARFVEVAEREPPRQQVREAWFCVGRRGGKDSIASAIATYFAVAIEWYKYLRPGEKATILCLAVDRIQAGIVFNYIKAYFEIVQLLKDEVHRITADTIELNNGCEIVVGTCSYRSLRGKTIALAILDECAFWRSDDAGFANPDVEVYSALVPALATLRRVGAMIIGISSVYRKAGLLYAKWREHHGQDSNILVVRAPSRTFNPTLDEADIQADIALDPARGEAEWLSEWRSDLADFIDRQVVESLVIWNRHELPPLQRQGPYYYVGFVDASGGSGGDSYTAAVAHQDLKTEISILDAVREIRPPFSPEAATAEHAAFFKSYDVHTVCGDKYAGAWPSDQFQKHGIRYEPSERSKSEIYSEILPALNAHKVELLDNPRLVSQLCGLERRVMRGTGRESIDHGVGRRDDVANACMGALLRAQADNFLAVWARL